MGSLSTKSKAALEQLKEKMPADLTPGIAIASTGVLDPDSPFIRDMKRFSKDAAQNAYIYYNFMKTNKGYVKRKNTIPRKVLSANGFPPSVSVTYSAPPPFAMATPQWPRKGKKNTRDINFFVFHSFGHGWHATSKGKKKIGWMNTRGVTAIPHDGQTVYIPKGSDPESLAHFTRFKAGLRACLGTAAAASAHFFIDRAGNLVVVGDVQDILYTSNQLNKQQVGVELEEAFYVVKDTKGRGNKAIWKAGGNPPGTRGTIEYFAYSPAQMLTLSIIVKKLQLVYPALQTRNTYFESYSVDKNSPPGFVIHDAIRGGPPKIGKDGKPKKQGHHIDVSPHFKSQELWDAFFDLVDSHEHLTSKDVFLYKQKYKNTGTVQPVAPLADSAVTAMTDRMLQYAKSQGIAEERASSMVNVSKRAVNNTAGTAAARSSHQTSQQVADTTNITQQTQDPPLSLPDMNLPTGADGLQVCSDDIY